MNGPLSGFRILDLTAVVLGPYATQILGDMGADVIKVEAPSGDMTREIGPRKKPGMAPIHLTIGRNKRSLVLDLKQSKAVDVLKQLAAATDVFVHSMRPHTIERLGLGYDDLKTVRPDVVYCGTYGFGADGPYAKRPAYDDMIQGMCGIADLVGKMTAGAPRYVPTIVADKTVGLFVANAILAALLHRERTGQGQAIEVPMFETMVSYVMVEHLWDRSANPDNGDLGYVRMMAQSRRPYRTLDGYICVLAYTDKHWKTFFELAKRPELGDDPRFVSIATRTENIAELYSIAEEFTRERTTQEWLTILEQAQIPAGPVNSLEDLMTDPHLLEQGLFQKFAHPSIGETLQIRPPVKFSKSPASLSRHAPLLGEHTMEVLREAGLSESHIEQLIREGAAVQV